MKNRKAVEKLWNSCGKAAEKLRKSFGKAAEKLRKSCEKAVEKLACFMIMSKMHLSDRARQDYPQ